MKTQSALQCKKKREERKEGVGGAEEVFIYPRLGTDQWFPIVFLMRSCCDRWGKVLVVEGKGLLVVDVGRLKKRIRVWGIRCQGHVTRCWVLTDIFPSLNNYLCEGEIKFANPILLNESLRWWRVVHQIVGIEDGCDLPCWEEGLRKKNKIFCSTL